MNKNVYIKPFFTFTTINTECSIATASVHIGPTIGNYVPNLEDYEEFPTTDGFGEL